jgi:hypothetical protein
VKNEKMVTLELRTARDNERGAEAIAQFFLSLPNPPHQWWKPFDHAPAVTLEFYNQGQTIYAFATVPESMDAYVRSQIAACYPEVLVKKLEHDPLDELRHPLPKKFGEVVLSGPSYLPLLTYKELPAETDSLAMVLSSLSRLASGETALIQIQIRKVRDRVKSHAYSLAQGSTKNADGTSSTPHPHRELIGRKAALPWFEARVAVVAQAPDQGRADQILDSLVTALGSLQSEGNSLVFKKPFFRKDKWLEQLLHRELPFTHQYFSVQEVATFFHLPNKMLSNIRNIAWGKNLLGEPPENLPTFSNTPDTERNDLNLFAKAEFKNESHIFGLKRIDRRRHVYVIGKSGTGKSTMLANMIINDLKHGEGIAVVDPHGDLIETVLNFVPRHRINDVILLDPSDPDAVVQLNLFEAGNEVHRELIASGIVAIFQKMYAHTWGPRLEYILRNALLTLLEQNSRLEDVLRLLTDDKYRARIVENLQDPILKAFWLGEFNKMQERQRVDAISPILNKVGQFVTSPLIRNVVNAQTSSFSINDVMDQGKILLVNVSQGKLGEDNASLLGAMIITKIQLAAMSRVYIEEEKRKDFYLYIDEFQNFATTSFVKILSEARKYRLNLILANQYIAQVPEEVKSAIFGNAGNIFSFIMGADDAAYFTKEFGDKFSAEDLVSLARYQVICKLLIDGQASMPFPAWTLSLAASRNQNKEKIMKVSRERYARKKT